MCQKALKNCDKVSVENIFDPEMKLISHDKPKAILVVFSDCYLFLVFWNIMTMRFSETKRFENHLLGLPDHLFKHYMGHSYSTLSGECVGDPFGTWDLVLSSFIFLIWYQFHFCFFFLAFLMNLTFKPKSLLRSSWLADHRIVAEESSIGGHILPSVKYLTEPSDFMFDHNIHYSKK